MAGESARPVDFEGLDFAGVDFEGDIQKSIPDSDPPPPPHAPPGLGFGAKGLVSRIWGLGLRVYDFGSRVSGLGFGFLVSGFWSLVSGFGYLRLMKQANSQFKNNCFAEMRSASEEGSYIRLIDLCMTQL